MSPVADREVDLAGWDRALEALVPTPPGCHERLLSPAEARAVLGCRPDVVEHLVASGLPVPELVDGEPRLDLHDVINVGLYSGAGTSMPELAQRALLRYAAGDPATWTAPVRWSIAVEHHCAAAPEPGTAHAGAWELAEPDPVRWGGEVEAWEVREGMRLPPAAGGPAAASPEHASVTGRVRLTGRAQRVLAGAVAEPFHELVRGIGGGAPRFQWLPAALRADPDAAARLGVVDCGAGSLLLARELGRRGFEAHAREGHVLGLVPTLHGWVEVRDEDGAWKALDPIFCALAGRVAGTRPEFAAFCLGSFSSRVLPWAVEAGAPIAAHRCPGGGTPRTTVLSGQVRS